MVRPWLPSGIFHPDPENQPFLVDYPAGKGVNLQVNHHLPSGNLT